MLKIGIGSKTSTGGVVIEGNPGLVFDGLVASSIGHKATCPACKKGIGPIVAVGPRTVMLPGGPAARAGDYVACGCPPGSNTLLPEGTISIGAHSSGSANPSNLNNQANYSGRFQLIDQETGKPAGNRKVKVWSSGGWSTVELTDGDGMTSWVSHDASQTLHIDLLQGSDT